MPKADHHLIAVRSVSAFQNLTPGAIVDRLGALKAQLADLKADEAALRGELIAHSDRRRFLRLAGATATATALLGGAAVVAGASVTDPCRVIAAERDRLRAIYLALDARVDAIAKANPAQMWGQGWPRVDRSLDVFNGTPWGDGYNLMR